MAKQPPKISIITPSYNQGDFIGQTIESVLAQDYPNLEYWVMDGGSTDNTLEILKSYGKKINWVSEPDKGQTDALNKGLARVSGDILAYINSDDVYMPGTFQKVAQLFEQHPEALWLTGEYTVVDENNQPREGFITIYKSIQRWLMMSAPFLQPIIMGINNPIIQPSTFWRRDLQDKIGLFSVDRRYTMDYEYWLKALKLGPALIVQDVFSAFRVHSQSKGGSAFHKQMNEQLETAKRQGVSPILLALQWLHNKLIIAVYSVIR
jgi:glycosyltransferase involved in cell wall biosynthesis